MVINKEEIWNCLSQIPDPDIPVISITDLGLVRDVKINKDKVTVSVTPSYSGCPAMQLFKADILSALKTKGLNEVEVKTVYSPPWTTDWISETAKEKMRKHGIAPPEKVSSEKSVLFLESKKEINCPWCNSKDTKRTSQFGSTPCKALWFCNSCHQPFEYFKCI
ncbi:MAG: phenylacetate-CoA oxygenase subunit PaaJ [Bacteroidetes bacterium]|nr:phenylacetate-CoA oxygenase subunit PaaJ [Bacteroidota bacterium]